MRIILNPSRCGYNVHVERDHVVNVDADKPRRCALHVPNEHHPGVARSCSRGLRSLGLALGSPTVPFRSSRLISLAAKSAAALLFGVSFAFPAMATNLGIGDGTHYFTSSPGISIVGNDFKYNCTNQWANGGNDGKQSKLELKFYEGANMVYDTGWIGEGVGDMYPHLAGSPSVFDYSNTYVLLENLGIPTGVYTSVELYCWDNWHATTPAGGNPVLTWDLISTSQDFTVDNGNLETLPGGPLPDSTYDDSGFGVTTSGPSHYDSYLPDISFTTSSIANTTSGTTIAHYANLVGSATDTIPLCIAYPWLQLLDVLQGFTSRAQSPQGLKFSGGIFGSQTFSLAAAPDVFENIGFKRVYDPIIQFIEVAMWLTFGFYVFSDIFAPEESNDETV